MRIGELATATGMSTKTLRFYEADGLLADPPRTPAGYRDYPDDAIDRVAFIRQAKAAGLTLAQVREILAIRDGGDPPCRPRDDDAGSVLAAMPPRLGCG